MAKDKVQFGAAMEDSTKFGGDSADRFEQQVLDKQAKQPSSFQPMEGGVAAPNIVSGAPQADWMSITKNFYENSTSWLDSNLRTQWERNDRMFQSKHPAGSKYLSESYKARSKLFRPKTRSSIRSGEAAAALAFFRNEDVVNISPVNASNPKSLASAAMIKQLVQYRLTSQNPRRGIPWYLTLIGAYQDTSKYGVVFSKQWWEFDEVGEQYGAFNDDGSPFLGEDGQQVMETRRRTKIDRPRIDLYPVEQVRLDRGASWIDPLGTSPVVQLLTPMYAGDLIAKANTQGADGTAWKNFTMDDLLATKQTTAWDSTRLQREGNREDSKESTIQIPEFKIVWVIENFVRWKGERYCYWTASTETQLSEPQLVHEIYRHCEEDELPIVMGQALVETHKLYPAGKPELVQELQKEANDVVNLRLDNVKLALNKRYLVKRGRMVDLRQVTRSTPGSAIVVSDKDDVVPMETRDVTQSSFAEQDRINLDFDETLGNFSPGSVQSNRKLNETVGGMELLQGSANMIGEYDLRTFGETWVEKSLRQVARMEAIYESDIEVLATAVQKADLQQFGVTEVNDDMLLADMGVKVNVGLGATDPQKQLEKLQIGTKLTGEILGPSVRARVNADEFLKEIWGNLGYSDGKRFFKPGPDPMLMQLQEEMAALQQDLERQTIAANSREHVARITAIGEIVEEIIKGTMGAQQAQMNAQVEDQRAERDAQREDQRAEKDAFRQDRQTQGDRQHDIRKQTMAAATENEARNQANVDNAKQMILQTALKYFLEPKEDQPSATGPAQPAQPGVPGEAAQPPGPADQPPPAAAGTPGL